MTWNLKAFFSKKSAPAAGPAAIDWVEHANDYVARQEWQAALDCYREAILLQPGRTQAHAYMGNVLRQLNHAEDALSAYERAIALSPEYAEAHCNRASLLLQMRRHAEALCAYEEALSADATLAEAHCGRGDALVLLGRFQDATASYDAAISARPGYARAYLRLGALQRHLGSLVAAEESVNQAISLESQNPEAHFHLGLIHHDVGKHEDALRDYQAALELRAEFSQALSNKAQVQAKLGLMDDAHVSHAEAVRCAPLDPTVHFNRATFLIERRQWQDAIIGLQTALSLDPNLTDAYVNLGLAQQEFGQIQAALDSYSRALAQSSDLGPVYNNRGNLHRSAKRFEQAMADFRQALVLDSGAADVHYNIGQLALLLGDLTEGWPEYEWRHRTDEARSIAQRVLPQPVWTGEPDLKGKSILLHAEQGLGDTLQFCRYVGLVAARGARVVLEVQPALGELLSQLQGVSQIVKHGSPLPATDYQCSLMSLPHVFKTSLATIPCSVPYLKADPVRVSRWHSILGPRSRPRVGVAWRGNPRNTHDPSRRIPLQQLLAHLPQGFEYVCLQKPIADEDRVTLLADNRVTVVDSHIEDFSDTAALVESLDLVISVCTSVAHLSGAMGQRTWVLLANLPDWRWLLDRRDSPWYPTVTLFRQTEAGVWSSALTELSAGLSALHGEIVR